MSHRQVKKRENSSIRANITEERRARKSTGGGGGGFFPMHNCCERHVVMDVHPLFYSILFIYYYFFMSLCACTCGAFSLHYFPCAARRGEGELLSSISGFAYVMTSV